MLSHSRGGIAAALFGAADASARPAGAGDLACFPPDPPADHAMPGGHARMAPLLRADRGGVVVIRAGFPPDPDIVAHGAPDRRRAVAITLIPGDFRPGMGGGLDESRLRAQPPGGRTMRNRDHAAYSARTGPAGAQGLRTRAPEGGFAEAVRIGD